MRKMKLTIAKRWKWLAKDADGEWRFHTHKPLIEIFEYWQSETRDSNETENINTLYAFSSIPYKGDASNPFKGDWKDSLHKRNGDEWEPVKS